ncbi:family 43 glycosylhydrolase [Paenibacillus lupini]|nr:S-layer homology domain-containing protein [Paenibacillus lupini]NIK22059.1 hypothetical protein [Paenibacillus lupini]
MKLFDTEALAKIPGYSNPLISHKLGADPFAMVYDGRVYIYMSSDEFEYDGNGNVKDNSFSNLNRVFVISSDDMVNWTDHGAIPVAGPNGIANWATFSWAPAAAHKKINGVDKFFLYFANGAGGIGVLTADSPIGPWTDPLGKPLVSGNTPGVPGVVWLFDPAVLVDDDGAGYLYFGGGIPGDPNPSAEQIAHPNTARVIKLGDDMVSTVGSAEKIDAPYMFEDSGIHKFNGKYYYTYCSNFAGTHPEGTPPAGEIAYMVSDNPMGPFTYVGPILKNPGVFFGVGGNNHHSIFEFNNEWYITYHAQTVSKAMIGDGKGYRSTHINKVEFYENGHIKDIKADMKGVSQLANLNPYTRTEAETIAWNAGIATEKSEAPGNPVEEINLDVTNVNKGDWLAVANADFGTDGAATFEANVASTSGGKIEIRVDSPIGDVIGTLDVQSTGGAQQWKLLKTEVTNVTGVHNIFFMFSGEEDNLFQIDYWKFTSKNPTSPVIPIESISLADAPASMKLNGQVTVNAALAPANATSPVYKWEASGAISIAGADNQAAVTIKGVSAGSGKLKLTVTAGGVQKQVEGNITVTKDSDSSNNGNPGTTTTEPSNPDEPSTVSVFSDLKGYSWAEEAINALAKIGVINGTSSTTFEPSRSVTRAEFVTLLVRAMGLKADVTDNFVDVPANAYYYEALGVVKQLGIALGSGDNAFHPNATISRQDMMVLVARVLEMTNNEQLDGNAADLSGFTDKDKIADYAAEALAALVKEGIVTGSGNGRLNPQGTATRAEAAVMIYRILNVYGLTQ